jgi:mono/diheme cytochrome c family protein
MKNLRFFLMFLAFGASGLAAAAAPVFPRADRAIQAPATSTAKPVSVWDGVYSPSQAARGKQSYEKSCASCHRSDLRGANGRALVGPRFWQDWGEDTLNSLYAVTRATMPRGTAGSLDDQTYLDIVAYVLQANDYPAGSSDLTADRVEAVRVIGKDGPGPVPNFALVTVVGCLVSQPGGVWSLRNATEPLRTRNPDPSKDTERTRSLALTPTEHSFELMDVYTAGEGHDGHRMEIKGLLIRGTRGAPDKLNMTGMQMLAADCQ